MFIDIDVENPTLIDTWSNFLCSFCGKYVIEWPNILDDIKTRIIFYKLKNGFFVAVHTKDNPVTIFICFYCIYQNEVKRDLFTDPIFTK